MKCSFLLVVFLAAFAPCVYGQKQTTVIRGKNMGFSVVSPVVQKAVDAKYGKKPAPDAKSKGPNATVSKHGFAYVSPYKPPKGK